MEAIEYPNGDTIAYGYDMAGNVIRRTTTRDSEAVTTHYKRDNLGRVCYKQVSDDPNWDDINQGLPFDEVLYDALGNRQFMIYVDDDTDIELNAYGYNGLGALVFATESFGGFSRDVSYGYDQRGLLTRIVYPNEKVVSTRRDALGRIESVSYDGKTLVEYGYLGDSVVSKTMAEADLEYAATIDLLGRITVETYSRTSTSQTVLDFDYDYTNHSFRLDERNGVVYGFDTLGRVTSEDSTSYLYDILGNPTNAPSSGLTYELDEEERIVQADDAIGTLGVYSYDRLGRRALKTVGSVETHFVYDIFGNIIAEYENGQWTWDYVYGANGEAVYMQFPQTAATGTAFSNFVSFVEAWLCSPYCTQNDLVWDINQDNQINLIDWSENVEYFEDAFIINGRYLLTDFRNSVVGKVNLDGSVDEIVYSAFGYPTVAQGVDLEGLTILWNGYYYDYETGNYYLRNRYYSPVERKFLTDDPHGINPDGNWNNPFFVFNQYIDGFGLQVYALGDPVNGWDGWGLMSDFELALKLILNYKFPPRSDPFSEGAEVVKRQHLVKTAISLAMEAYSADICSKLPRSPIVMRSGGFTFMDMGTILSYARIFVPNQIIACQDSFWMLHTLNGATGFNIRGHFTAKRQCDKCEVRFAQHHYTFLDRADMHFDRFPDSLIIIDNFLNPWHRIGVVNQEYDIAISWQDTSTVKLKYQEGYKTKWLPIESQGWPFK